MRAASTQVTPTQQETPKVKVVVASHAVAVREMLQAGDVETRAAPADIVPESAIRSIDEVVGWISTVPLVPGEMILSTQLISPTIKGEAVAYVMDKGKVAIAFPADDLLTRNNLLQAGDHVDVLFSIKTKGTDANTEGGIVTFSALQNLEVAALVRSGNLEAKVNESQPVAIIFAVDPQDALVLKYLKDVGSVVDMVLRAPESKERFEEQPVHMDYLSDRYQLHTPVTP